MFEFAPLKLKKHEDRRLRHGHLWVFSNEVDTIATPLSDFDAGQPVVVLDHREQFLGSGYINPHSLICVRLLSRDKSMPFSTGLVLQRLRKALSLRQMLYAKPYYRLVNSEGDNLPGLTIDRFADILVVQITTAGMECLKDEIVAMLEELLNPAAILLRNDHPVRELEALLCYIETPKGVVPQTTILEEDGLQFEISLLRGQKTGWYYDQHENRNWLSRVNNAKRMLDVFSYVGAWGVRGAAAGAREVFCVDESRHALEMAMCNARHNGVEQQVKTLHGDAFKVLKQLSAEEERFDLIVLDPPAFVKRKKDLKEGVIAYRRINESAIKLLSNDGILISCSCSHHIQMPVLVEQISKAARRNHRTLQVLSYGQQGSDHPVHPAIPETAYLKAVYCRVGK